MKRNYKFEKSTNKSSFFLDNVKQIHDAMKQEGCPVDIEYDGPYAEVLLPAGFLSKLKGADQPKLATIVWNITEPDIPAWNIIVYNPNGKKVATVADEDKAVDALLDLYEKAAPKKK